MQKRMFVGNILRGFESTYYHVIIHKSTLNNIICICEVFMYILLRLKREYIAR